MNTSMVFGKEYSVRLVGHLTKDIQLYAVSDVGYEQADDAETAVQFINEQWHLGLETWNARAFIYSDEINGWLVKVHTLKVVW